MITTNQTIKECINKSSLYLKPITDVPRLEAEILLGYILNLSRADIYMQLDRQLSTFEQEKYFEAVNLRQTGMPIAYIMQKKEFWSINFFVNEHVLIPRADTECLVEAILARYDNSVIKLLDLGTGSGAIAISIALERKNWEIFAIDKSIEALSVAKINQQKNKVTNLELIQSNWLDELSGVRFDVIVSNPPYIAAHDPHLISGDVRFEPLCALAGGNDGLAELNTIIESAPSHLVKGGMLIVEHGFDQAELVSSRFAKAGFSHLEVMMDLAGLDRATLGYLGGKIQN